MKDFFGNIASIMEAANGNPLGLLALAALALVVVVVLLLNKGPLWSRFLAVVLVFVTSSTLAVAVFRTSFGASGTNGSLCSAASDCKSGSCYPGPHPFPVGSTQNPANERNLYCVADGRNCALPGLDGAMYGTTIFKDGSALTCKDLDNGGRGQFVR